jgi:GNAT superfamily N-acetyltransferase
MQAIEPCLSPGPGIEKYADMARPGRPRDPADGILTRWCMSTLIETSLEFHPVTHDRLPDLERFSGEHGKFRYCSCMRWRMTSSRFKESTARERAAALAGLVLGGTPVGILAYAQDRPVGWCSVAPRETYEGLARYKVLPRLDDEPVWAVVCFFIDREFRRRGSTRGLLGAAVGYAVSSGASIIEGYPVAPNSGLYTYMGSPATFGAAGFVDVTPPGRERRVMRYVAGKQ